MKKPYFITETVF